MTFQGDPYRTLGIAPGASLNEIRSAYRRLAKQYHPDAAGERALPRFLAIQAAYERLVDGEGRLRPGRRAGAARRRGASRGARTRPGRGRRATRGGRGGPGARRRREPARRDGRCRRAANPAAAGAGTRRRRLRAGATGGAVASAGRREHHARRGPRKATPGLHDLRRGRRDAARPGVGRRRVVRAELGHVLDDQPARVRRPPQARPRVPGPGPRAPAGPMAADEPARRGRPAAGPDRGGRARRRAAATRPPAARGPAPASRRRPAGAAPVDDRRWQRELGGPGSWRYDDVPPRTRPGAGGATRVRRRAAAAAPPAADAPPCPDLESSPARPRPRTCSRSRAGRTAAGGSLLALARLAADRYASATLVADVTGCAAFAAVVPGAASRSLPLLVQPLVIAGLFARAAGRGRRGVRGARRARRRAPGRRRSCRSGRCREPGSAPRLLGVSSPSPTSSALVAGAHAVWRRAGGADAAGAPAAAP